MGYQAYSAMQENEEMQGSLDRPNSSQNFSCSAHGGSLTLVVLVFHNGLKV